MPNNKALPPPSPLQLHNLQLMIFTFIPETNNINSSLILY